MRVPYIFGILGAWELHKQIFTGPASIGADKNSNPV